MSPAIATWWSRFPALTSFSPTSNSSFPHCVTSRCSPAAATGPSRSAPARSAPRSSISSAACRTEDGDGSPDSRVNRKNPLPIVRQLLRMRHLLRGLSEAGDYQARPGTILPRRRGALHGLRCLLRTVPLPRHRDVPRTAGGCGQRTDRRADRTGKIQGPRLTRRAHERNAEMTPDTAAQHGNAAAARADRTGAIQGPRPTQGAPERNAEMALQTAVLDGNTAAAHVAYRVNEVCAIYPITPSSTMAEVADVWASEGLKNIWGQVPIVQQMQSEGGAAGAVHGALQSGALTTTFTASQGFLLMLPNMYKIAGELTSCVFHVAARAVATQALSIFGDHSDVMSARMTGFAMLSAASVQEAHDLALVAQAATLEARVPIIFFFDGFRTSHEENTATLIPDEQIRAMIDDDLVRAHRARALSPEHPVLRGTAHNPDTFFQARETVNPFYAKVPGIVQKAMDRLGALTGRKYQLFRYAGHPQAERVAVAIGSSVEVLDETAAWLAAKAGEKVGVLQVRLYRPWDGDAFLAAMPKSVKALAVLDRTKEVGSQGEPLYMDVLSTYARAAAAGKVATMPTIIGGRYGLSSKDFDPPMAKAVFDELKKRDPKHGFTVGITDDVSNTSLPVDRDFDIETPDTVRALFYGLGADGTVGANKNSTKILASEPGRYAQGYFEYDSKKSGSYTISHLRFGPKPIRAPYLIKSASFVGVHKFDYLFKIDTLAAAATGGALLLNSPFGPDQVWNEVPREVQQQIIAKRLK